MLHTTKVKSKSSSQFSSDIKTIKSLINENSLTFKQTKNFKKILEVYGSSPDNWGDLPNFKGDYINFGYWEDIKLNKTITLEERINSSINLYREIIKYFNITNNTSVVEIGCGRGAGIIDVLSKMQIGQIIGIDINPAQIVRAKKNIRDKLEHSNNITLRNVSANNTTLADHSVDKVYSIEVAQHFSSMIHFTLEMKRILKPGGELTFATYFLTNKKYLDKLKMLLPLIDESLENTFSVNEVRKHLYEAGFNNVSYRSIGEHTFAGYETWITQAKTHTPFSHNYYKAFQAGYVDYYVINAC